MKKVIGLVLALCMILGCVPVWAAGYMAEVGGITYAVENGEATAVKCKWEVGGSVYIESEIEGCPVTKIGEKAFENCGQIKSVTIPDSVKVIERAAFNRCVNLKEVNGMKNVEVIGERAFHQCNLEAFTMPEKVKRIEFGAFANNWFKKFETGDNVTFIDDSALRSSFRLEEVVIGDLVTEIGTQATGCANEDFTTKNSLNERTPVFENCYCLKTITLGKSVKYIYPNTFSGIETLENIFVSEENPYLKSVEGVLFTKDGKSLICYPMGKSDKEYTIPDGVEIVDDKAFYNCKTEKVNVPEGLKHIGSYNGVLDNADVPSRTVTRGKQGDIDWVYDNGVLTFTGEGVLTDTFNGTVVYPTWERLRVKKIVVNEGITEIDGMRGHISMTELVLPKSLEKIGTLAFADCDSLENLVLPENVTEIGIMAFDECDSLREVTLTSKVPVKIERSAFDIADGSVIHLPETVTEIHTHAFTHTFAVMHGGYGCYDEDCDITIDAPAGSYAYTWAIENNFKVTDSNKDVRIIDGVLCIKRGLLFEKLAQLSDAFGGAYKTEGWNFGITKHGRYLVVTGFEVTYKENGMTVTENIYVNDEYVRVPVRGIKATLGCELLHEPDSIDKAVMISHFIVEETDDRAVIKGLKKNIEELVIPSVINGKRVEIDSDAFRGNSIIKTLVIEDGIEEIPAWAFYACGSLEKVDLGGVKRIGENAFRYCTKLKEINLEKVEELKSRAFGDCISLEEIELLSIQSWQGISDSDIVNWTVPRRYHDRLYYYESVVVFPPFYGCTGLKKATLRFPEGEKAFPTMFTNCSNLEKVVFLNYTAPLCKAEFCNLRLAHHRFDDADRFTERVDVTIYSDSYEAKQYAKTEGLKFVDSIDAVNEVWIKDGVLTASEELFEMTKEALSKYKNETKKLVLTEGVKEIPDEFFMDWPNLDDVKLPRGLEKIGDRAFKGCEKLYWISLSASLGSSVKQLEVGEEAFMDCTALRQASFYSDVKIGDRAFENCRVLYQVNMNDTARVSLGEGVFNDCRQLRVMDLYNVEFEGLYPFASPDKTSVLQSLTLCKGFEASLLAKDTDGNVIDRLPQSVVSIDVIGDNKKYAQYNGAVYTKDMKTLCYCPKNKDMSTYQFPEETQSVYVGALNVADYKYLPGNVKLIVPELTVEATKEGATEVVESDKIETSVSILSEPQNGPDNLFDNDFISYCVLFVTDEEKPEYIEFKLDEVKRVEQLALAFRNATSRTTYFDVRVSEDGINYETVIEKRGSNADTDKLQYFDINRDARYIRVYGYSNTFNRYWVSITEARVIAG